MKVYNTSFNFAIWKLNDAKKNMERIKHSNIIYVTSNYTESDGRSIQLGKLIQQIDHWQSITAILCPGHKWEKENKEDNDHPSFKCQVCGFIKDDYDALYYIYENLVQGCHNCKYLEIDGGDSVPYGSGSATLPEVEYCVSENLPVMSCDSEDDDLEYFQEEFMKDNAICPLWEGK